MEQRTALVKINSCKGFIVSLMKLQKKKKKKRVRYENKNKQ